MVVISAAGKPGVRQLVCKSLRTVLRLVARDIQTGPERHLAVIRRLGPATAYTNTNGPDAEAVAVIADELLAGHLGQAVIPVRTRRHCRVDQVGRPVHPIV